MKTSNAFEKWNEFCSQLFKSEKAKAKPWRALGIRPATWASRELRARELVLVGGESYEPADYGDTVEETPEALCIAREDLGEPEAAPVAYVYRRPGGLRSVPRTPSYVEAIPYGRIVNTLEKKAARWAA